MPAPSRTPTRARSRSLSSSPASATASSAASSADLVGTRQSPPLERRAARLHEIERHFGGDLAAIAGRIERRHRADAALPGQHAVPRLLARRAEAADDADAGDRDALHSRPCAAMCGADERSRLERRFRGRDPRALSRFRVNCCDHRHELERRADDAEPAERQSLDRRVIGRPEPGKAGNVAADNAVNVAGERPRIAVQRRQAARDRRASPGETRRRTCAGHLDERRPTRRSVWASLPAVIPSRVDAERRLLDQRRCDPATSSRCALRAPARPRASRRYESSGACPR